MPKTPVDPFIRLMSRVSKDKDGCWTWTGPTKNGYSHVGLPGGSFIYGHRLSYQRHVGEIPNRYRIHHKCENPRCVNPEHLEPVTASEHAREHGLGGPTCARCGSSDLYRSPLGRQTCRACRRLRRAGRTHPCPICGEPARLEAATCSNRCGAILHFNEKGRVEYSHGTTGRYKRQGCRCPECRAANTAAENTRRARFATL